MTSMEPENNKGYELFSFQQNWVMIVLLAILVICPWPILGLSIKPSSSPHLVVVPVDYVADVKLASPVSPIFGRSRYFMVIDLEKNNKVKVIPNQFRTEKHAVGLRIAHLLLNEKAGVVIAQNIGPEPFNNLTERGAQVFIGNPGTVQDAIDQFKNGQLTRVEQPTVKIHFGLEQQKALSSGRVF